MQISAAYLTSQVYWIMMRKVLACSEVNSCILEKRIFRQREEQFNALRTGAAGLDGPAKKVIIRTLDIGADKRVDYF